MYLLHVFFRGVLLPSWQQLQPLKNKKDTFADRFNFPIHPYPSFHLIRSVPSNPAHFLLYKNQQKCQKTQGVSNKATSLPETFYNSQKLNALECLPNQLFYSIFAKSNGRPSTTKVSLRKDTFHLFKDKRI